LQQNIKKEERKKESNMQAENRLTRKLENVSPSRKNKRKKKPV
jgi:hypothetical protein